MMSVVLLRALYETDRLSLPQVRSSPSKSNWFERAWLSMRSRVLEPFWLAPLRVGVSGVVSV